MIKTLFRQMLLTQILSAMTVTLCMLIDNIMIGRFLGVDSMTAYGLATPILLVFAALGSMISAGIQVMCGKTMGTGDTKSTNGCYSTSVSLTGIISVVGVLAVIIFTQPICDLLGAGVSNVGAEVSGLTKDYLRGFIIGAPAFMFSLIMVPYMQISGSRTRLVVAVAAMTVADVIFDLLNVLVFHGGTFGMGLASSLSYYVAFFIGVPYFFKKSCIFKFSFSLVSAKNCKYLIKYGVPTLINQISLVLLTFVLNNVLLDVGRNLAVAAYSVISTVGNICYSFSSGIAAVALMLSSILFADGDRTALKTLVRTMTVYAVAICGVVTAVIFAFAEPLITLFITNPAAKGIAVKGLRIFVLSLVPCALNTTYKNYYQGVDKEIFTQVISVLQNFALTALSAFLLSRFMGVTGVWTGFICGEGLTLVVICIVVFVRKGFGFTTEKFALLDDDYGVSDDKCFEVSVTDITGVVAASEKAGEFCKKHHRLSKLSTFIALSIEEMAYNIVSHGFDGENDTSHSIDIRLILLDNSCILRIRDNCKGFDPVKYLELHADDEDPTAHIGIRMVMRSVRDARYVNSMGLNNLTLTF